MHKSVRYISYCVGLMLGLSSEYSITKCMFPTRTLEIANLAIFPIYIGNILPMAYSIGKFWCANKLGGYLHEVFTKVLKSSQWKRKFLVRIRWKLFGEKRTLVRKIVPISNSKITDRKTNRPIEEKKSEKEDDLNDVWCEQETADRQVQRDPQGYRLSVQFGNRSVWL